MDGRRVRFLLLIPVSIVFLMAHNARSQNRSTSAEKLAAREDAVSAKSRPKKLSPAANAWVETTLRKMSVDEKIGQLLFTTYHGSLTATDTAAYQQIMHDVTDLHVGGFINITHGSPLGIVKSQAYPSAILNNQLQAKSKLPLLIGADFERGTAMRLDEGTSFPTAMALAAGGNLKDAYTMGKITALESRAVGVRWIYAPDADVNNNPGNPIINTRSFGENPERVAKFVGEFVRGVQENGGLATAKHFPGHGDTAADSHIDLPVIRADRARLDSLELVPFRAAISMQVDSIMTGHLNVPALEPDPNTPATLSHNILTDVLRKQLGFQGLVVTDAMDMGGITVRYAPGEAAVRAVVAGAGCRVRSVASGGEVRTNSERASRCVGAENSASESAAGLEHQPARGRECAQSQIRQCRVAERSARNFRPRPDFVAGYAAPSSTRCDEIVARIIAGLLRRSGAVSRRRSRARVAFAIRFRDDAASRHQICECFHSEITAAGQLRRCDSCAVCARQRSQGKCGCTAGAGGAWGANL